MKAESTEAGATNFTFDDEEELPGLVPVDNDSTSVSGGSGSSSVGSSGAGSGAGGVGGSVGGSVGSESTSGSNSDDSNDVFSVKRVDKITSGVQDDGEEGEFY